MDVRNMPWVGHEIEVTSSSDPSYVGRTGLVVDESRRMVFVQEGEKTIELPKQEIFFRINQSKIIDGRKMNKKPEDRINHKFKR
tara:strand:- start:258 stop:509 length:252 start_codon:yes stop_codon:yes gene_type:complete